MTGWVEALDALEERLRRQEAVAATGAGDIPEDGLPEVDGPLPAELRARAVTLLERTRRLEAVVEERLAAGAPRRPSYSAPVFAGERGADHGSL